MTQLTQITDYFLQTAEVEAQTPILVGGRLPDYRALSARSTTELIALGKLLGLRRRSLGVAPPQLAQKVGIPIADLLRLEEGVVGPGVLAQFSGLARELALPEDALLELAGVRHDPTGRIHPSAQTLVARTTLASPTTRWRATHAAVSC